MNSTVTRYLTVTLSLLIATIIATQAAIVTLPSIYADHMVIQTDQPIVISGTVSPTIAEVEVTIAGQSVKVTPRLFGGWTAQLEPVSEAGGSHTLTISADGEVAATLENVTFGDVWLCGGQSNMEWDMTTINDSAAEVAGADFPDIRLMEVSLVTNTKPLDDVKKLQQAWEPCSPAAVRQFSGVGYLFGRELHEETGRPIGLIQSAWGGSRIETWIPDSALRESTYGENVAGRNFGNPQHKPSICYNAMIHGLAPLALKGVIWYQGESNDAQPEEYRSLHETLITSWRDLWQQPELPFYFVQLANWDPGNRWELLREAQTQTLAVPHTGMAVTIDIGTANDIHPRNKQGTASRLAAIALANVYGQDRVYSGPLLKSATTDGHDITLHFDHVGSGLVGVNDGDKVDGFEVFSALGNWSPVKGVIIGDTVVVKGTLFRTNPQGIRYGWESNPVVSLKNKEGFPAVPFRFEAFELTYDSWKDRLVGKERLPSEDANDDGVSNLMTYATAGEKPQLWTRADGTRSLSFRRRASASELAVSLERSTDLQSWTEAWTDQQSVGSGHDVEEAREWGADLWDRYLVTLPAGVDPNDTYYRVRYRLP